MNYFSTAERRVKGVTILDIRGKLKGCGGRCQLREAVFHPLEEGYDQILLNLAQVSAIDSSCLGELVSMHVYFNDRGAKMRMVLSQPLQMMITITNLMNTFDIYENETDALDKFLCDTLDPDEPSNIFTGDLDD
ncbi:MAG: STAS domain-containing protein [Acidobacteriota bacterium]